MALDDRSEDLIDLDDTELPTGNERIQLAYHSSSHGGPTRHAGVQQISRFDGTTPAYFLASDVFSDGKKQFIRQYCHDKPSTVMERMRERYPNMEQSYKQVKGAVHNERRKQKRRESNGPWSDAEMQVIEQNLDLTPKALVDLLSGSIPGSAKNVDQVRDVRNLAQKKKGTKSAPIMIA